jgi:putative DNA primase/helicase
MTDAKRALIQLSLPSEVRFLNDWVAGDTKWPVCPCLASSLYTAYQRWCRANGETHPRPSNQFGGSLIRQPGWVKKKARIHLNAVGSGPTVVKQIVFPPDKILQDAGSAQPPAEDTASWLGESVLKFDRAMDDQGDRWNEK